MKKLTQTALLVGVLTLQSFAQDQKSLVPYAGTWDAKGCQIKVEPKSEALHVQVVVGSQKSQLRIPYQRSMELPTGSELLGEFRHFKITSTESRLSLVVECRGQGSPTLHSSGMLKSATYSFDCRLPGSMKGVDGTVTSWNRSLQVNISESVQEGMALRSFQKSFTSQ